MHLEAPVSVLAADIVEFAQPRDEVFILTFHFARHLFLVVAVVAVVPWYSPDPGSCFAKSELLAICRYLFCRGYLGLRLGLVAVREFAHIPILVPLEVAQVNLLLVVLVELPRRYSWSYNTLRRWRRA